MPGPKRLYAAREILRLLGERAAEEAAATAASGGGIVRDPGGAAPTPSLAAVLAAGESAGGLAIEDLADPSAAQDAATKAYVDAQSGGSMVPYFIADGDSFTVPEFKQALFSETISGPGLLVVTGMLIEVE